MKKFLSLLIAITLLVSLVGCGKNSKDDVDVKTKSVEQNFEEKTKKAAEKGDIKAEKQQQEYKDTIENEDASLKCIGFEKANSQLVEGEENIYIFKFDFVNKATEPKQAQNYFTISLFQNGAQLEDSFSYSSKGGDQYKLVGKFFDEAMGGGKITFGKIVQVVDDSPVTVYMKGNGIDIEPTSVVIDIANASEN